MADLLAERARLRFMTEIEAKCQGCKGSVADRKRAISLYEMLLKETNKESEGIILFQLGHLYEMGGNTPKALSLFGSVVNRSRLFKPELVSRTHEALGDLHFHKGQYKFAADNYTKALSYSDAQNKGLMTYRIA